MFAIAAAQPHRQFHFRGALRDFETALRVMRDDHGQEIGKLPDQPAMHRHDNLFLAGIGPIGNPHRTRPDPREKPRQGGLIHRRRRKIIFEIAGHLNLAHAEFGETPRVDVCLRKTNIDALQERSSKGRKPAPNQKRPRRTGWHRRAREECRGGWLSKMRFGGSPAPEIRTISGRQ